MTMPPGDYPDPMTQEVDLGYQRGWDDAMAEKPPCACGGKEPIAEATGWAEEWSRGGFFEEEDEEDDGETRVLTLFPHQIIPEEARRFVRVLVFDLPGGKPCS